MPSRRGAALDRLNAGARDCSTPDIGRRFRCRRPGGASGSREQRQRPPYQKRRAILIPFDLLNSNAACPRRSTLSFGDARLFRQSGAFGSSSQHDAASRAARRSVAIGVVAPSGPRTCPRRIRQHIVASMTGGAWPSRSASRSKNSGLPSRPKSSTPRTRVCAIGSDHALGLADQERVGQAGKVVIANRAGHVMPHVLLIPDGEPSGRSLCRDVMTLRQSQSIAAITSSRIGWSLRLCSRKQP